MEQNFQGTTYFQFVFKVHKVNFQICMTIQFIFWFTRSLGAITPKCEILSTALHANIAGATASPYNLDVRPLIFCARLDPGSHESEIHKNDKISRFNVK